MLVQRLVWNIFSCEHRLPFSSATFCCFALLFGQGPCATASFRHWGTNMHLQSTRLLKSHSRFISFRTCFHRPSNAVCCRGATLVIVRCCQAPQWVRTELHFRPLDSTNDLFAGLGFSFDVRITQIIQAVNSPHFKTDSPIGSKQSQCCWWVWFMG